MSQLRGGDAAAEAEGRGFADCNQTAKSLYSMTGKMTHSASIVELCRASLGCVKHLPIIQPFPKGNEW